jgi:hypothetical protein
MVIGIQRLWYGPPIPVPANGAEFTSAMLKTYMGLATTVEVQNVHDDTMTYEESDPTTENYINQLSGLTYHIDKITQAAPIFNFSLGQYTFDDMANLIGGTPLENGKIWKRPNRIDIIQLAVIGKYKTGVLIVFPKANIIAKGGNILHGVGVGVVATALETGADNLGMEYFVDASLLDNVRSTQDGVAQEELPNLCESNYSKAINGKKVMTEQNIDRINEVLKERVNPKKEDEEKK